MEYEDLIVDLRYNKIRNVYVDEFEVMQRKNITLFLGNNPIWCDCELSKFVKYSKTDAKNIKVKVDDLYCIGPVCKSSRN